MAGDDYDYDWYLDFHDISKHLSPYLDGIGASAEIFIPGCGSSPIGPRLYEMGFPNITCVDWSAVLIQRLQDQYASLESMEYSLMDVRSLEHIPNNCFDLIIEKALMDALLCGNDQFESVDSMLHEMDRVLKVGGHYICISHAGADKRLAHFARNNSNWDVDEIIIPRAQVNELNVNLPNDKMPNQPFYMYVCTKL